MGNQGRTAIGFVESPLRPTSLSSVFFILKIVSYPLFFFLSYSLKRGGFVADLVGSTLAVPYPAVAPFDTPVSVRASAVAQSVDTVCFPAVYSLQAS